MGFTAQYADPNTAPGVDYPKVTKADSDLPKPARSLVCGTPGTVNLMQLDGTVRTDYPLQQGYNPIACKQVRLGGTADDIWAITE